MRQRGWRLTAKRAFDIGVAGALLVGTAPVLVGASALLVATMGRPVLFRQERVGRDGRIFRIYKFRTMRPAAPDTPTAEDADRITPLGELLRSSSIDELPQLVNVLKGDMSLVGPRPLLVRYLPRYSARQARRHEVLPGLTGWAQVNGRNAASWNEKFDYDLEYVEQWGIRMDLKVLAKTVATVCNREGVSAADHATMPEFTGSGSHP